MIDILVISISNPILVGIYRDDLLIKEIEKDGMTSDVLPFIFEKLLKQYDINKILYVNGPGSFMAIKVGYIFLKTLSITNDIILKACNGFIFNNNSPIKALGKKYFFIDKNDEIYLDFLKDDTIQEEFKLPKKIDKNIGSANNLPSYNLPAVN